MELTILKRNSRFFLVRTSTGHFQVCNIEELNEVVEALECRRGYFKIFYCDGERMRKASNKMLKAFFAAHKIEMKFEQ